jgi:flagella basal body P-ring formation protein FlgA
MYTKIFLCIALITCMLFCRALADEKANDLNDESGIQIYLPREITIKDGTLKLGKIGIIRGPESLAAKAGEITLGRFSTSDQKIVIERHIILSRLASHGISSSQVTLKGAEKVTISRLNKIIGRDEFVKMAGDYLEDNISNKSISKWNPVRRPKDLVIPGPGKDIRFVHRLVPGGARNQTKVEISVFSGDELIGTREVTFAMQYNVRKAVTLVDIPAGSLIIRENVKIEQVTSNNPEPADWQPPYGLVAKRTLPAETVLKTYMIGSAESPVVIKRNQNVVIRIERPGFLITAVGKAMQDGKVGEYIKVRNIDSQRIILAKVNEDRSVEPVI